MAKQQCPHCGRYTAKKKGWFSSVLKCAYCGAQTLHTKKAIKKGIIRRRTIGYEEHKMRKGGEKWRKNWLDLREKALERAGHKCQQCGSMWLLEVHHKKHVVNGGKDKLSNLVVLCQDCHDKVHAEDRKKHKKKGCFLIPFSVLIIICLLVILYVI
ncbi:hypothetical protein BH10CHL1_BH10CHL1_17950 [soil metagenome]